MRALLVEIRLKTLNHTVYLEMPTKKGNNTKNGIVVICDEKTSQLVLYFDKDNKIL
jgi:hypothetical protein